MITALPEFNSGRDTEFGLQATPLILKKLIFSFILSSSIKFLLTNKVIASGGLNQKTVL